MPTTCTFSNSSFVAVVQLLSCVQFSATPWTAACQASPSFTISQSLLKFMSIQLVMLTISSLAIPFSFCLQSFPSSESFTMSQLFKLGGQNIGASASASVLPANTLIMIEIEFFFGPIFIIPPNNNSGISTPFIEYSYFPVYLSENSRNFH